MGDVQRKIKHIKLVDKSKRDRRCFFCGTDKSVKYDGELEDGTVAPCCNKCAFLYYVIGED